MKLNCKPGDLAVIVREAKGRNDLCGRIVEVVGAAPVNCLFDLPDGYQHNPVDSSGAFWVCRFANKITAPTRTGARLALYGVISDAALRPLRPGDGEDETLTWAGKPEGVAA